jgi:hypothetical protein
MFGIDDAAIAIGGSSIISGLLGSKAAGQAADAQRYAADTAAGVQREMYDTTRADLAPYRDAGVPALQRLAFLTGTGGDSGAAGYGSLTKPFDYSWSTSTRTRAINSVSIEGEKAIERSMTAAGFHRARRACRR